MTKEEAIKQAIHDWCEGEQSGSAVEFGAEAILKWAATNQQPSAWLFDGNNVKGATTTKSIAEMYQNPEPLYKRPVPHVALNEIKAALPPFDEHVQEILGLICYQCIRIANRLREQGQIINTKAEAEQAAVIYFLLGCYQTHGEQWRERANELLKGDKS